MMRKYFKIEKNGYIELFGIGECGTPLSEKEYLQIVDAIKKLNISVGKGYKLRADLTWEEYDLPPVEEPSIYTEESLQDLSNAELQQILADMGISANMNKANMIRLILAEQEAAE